MRLMPLSFLFLVGGLAVAACSQPSKELEKLSVLLGQWESKETSTAPDGKKTDFTLKGTNRWILGDRYLEIKESFEVSGRKFENLILMGYAPDKKVYRAWWYTNNSPHPIVFDGVFEGKNLTLTSEPVEARSSLRIVYNFVEDGRFDAVLEVQREGKWTTATVAEYRRTGK